MKRKTKPIQLSKETLRNLERFDLGWAAATGETYTGACHSCYVSCKPTNCAAQTCPQITCPC